MLKEFLLARDRSGRKEPFFQGPRWIWKCLKLSVPDVGGRCAGPQLREGSVAGAVMPEGTLGVVLFQELEHGQTRGVDRGVGT